MQIELIDVVSSKSAQPGQRFGIRLAEPLIVDGKTLMAAGALGQGEVIDAAPAGMGGKSGKLVLAARFVEKDGVRLQLRAMQLGGGGENRLTETLVVSQVAGFAGLFIQGGEITYPPGVRASAKVAVDMDLAPLDGAGAPTPAAPAPATPPSNPSQQGPAR